MPEHAITAHLERMECASCHAAWAAQEYGTFLIRSGDDRDHERGGIAGPRLPRLSDLIARLAGGEAEPQDPFVALPLWGGWRKSAYLRSQDAPPLGLNARGRVAPIRPQFVLFVTDRSRGEENHLRAAEWKPFAPHTIRRGSVGCAGCHDDRRRFLLERDEDRLYLLDQDGLSLRSFWNRQGQTVMGGSFLPEAHHTLMNRRTPEYVRQHLRQWQNLLERADHSSAR